jgi:hypothetical protein
LAMIYVTFGKDCGRMRERFELKMWS